MRDYRQLTEEDRIEIYAMKQAGNEQNIITEVLGFHPSTISRELARNAGLRGYRPKQAQQKALHRRFTARKAVKMTPETIDYIEAKLSQEKLTRLRGCVKSIKLYYGGIVMVRRILLMWLVAVIVCAGQTCLADGAADLAAAQELWDSRDYSQAQTAYSDIVEAYPGSDYELLAKGRLAQFYISRQSRDAAEQLLSEMFIILPENWARD